MNFYLFHSLQKHYKVINKLTESTLKDRHRLEAHRTSSFF